MHLIKNLILKTIDNCWVVLTQNRQQVIVILGCLILAACVKNRNFNEPESDCDAVIIANSTYKEIQDLYVDQTIQIQEDLIIDGYVISSDESGNFFGVLHFQDKPVNPTQGFQVEIDLRDSHLFYPVGSKIAIKLKGLYLGKSKGIFKIGGVFSSFGNFSVGRLPALIVQEHLFVLCDSSAKIEPVTIALQESFDDKLNTLVRFNKLEISEEELEKTFALQAEETKRTLQDCQDDEIVLLNSGYSDFQGEVLPSGSGTITGILQKENNDYFLVIRDLNDINFIEERCEDFIDEFTSTSILISEIADPENNSEARFIELYNTSNEPFSLKGWTLKRYTNASTTVSSLINLTNYTIEAESTLVIAPNASEFELTYGFLPSLEVGSGSVADSNGDDNIELVDPFGTVMDVFGVIGEDGSGTNHEFEDGRAMRKLNIVQSNNTYTFSEWEIFNDTGAAGTTNLPQIAPDDFNPKIR